MNFRSQRRRPSIKHKFPTLFVLIVFQIGCASIAHSPYACESVSERLNLYGWPYKLLGNITQVGDCAASKNLKVETGDYYRYYKSKIDDEVERKFTELEGYELNHFARALNCSPESYPRFHTEVIRNRNEIFGEKFDRSSREVTKSVQRLIDHDEELSKLCK